MGERLGRGSFGEVFKALNLQTGQFAAVKVMNSQSLKVAQIQLEIDILRRVDHPNIIKYLDCSTSTYKGKPYIIFELIENGSLKDIIGRFGVFSEELARRYIYQILKGLDYLHSNNILHRDIKAANILITKEGICKLADFGVAAEISDDKQTVSAVGTLAWMAPELFGVGEVTSACDIWSLGCLIVELLNGAPPYHHLSQMEVLYNLLEKTDPPPLPEGLSENLHDFLLKCFAHDPAARPSTSELLEHPWISGIIEKKNTVEELQEELMEIQKTGGRRRGVVLYSRPSNMDEIIKKALPYLPEAIPCSQAFSSCFMGSQSSKRFGTVSEMNDTLNKQTSILQKINSNPIIEEEFKKNYETLLALASAYKEKLQQATDEKQKLQKRVEVQKSHNNVLSARQTILEQQFSGKQLCDLYLNPGAIESLPDETQRGVLMVKIISKGKPKWKKVAVAILDKFFMLYEFDAAEEPFEVHNIDKCVVHAISEDLEGTKHCFSVNLHDTDKEILLLRAANEDIKKKWMNLFIVNGVTRPTWTPCSPSVTPVIMSARSKRATKYSPLDSKSFFHSKSCSSSFEHLISPKRRLKNSASKNRPKLQDEHYSIIAQKVSECTQNINTTLTQIPAQTDSEKELISEAKLEVTKLKQVAAVLAGDLPYENLAKMAPSATQYQNIMRTAYSKQLE